MLRQDLRLTKSRVCRHSAHTLPEKSLEVGTTHQRAVARFWSDRLMPEIFAAIVELSAALLTLILLMVPKFNVSPVIV